MWKAPNKCIYMPCALCLCECYKQIIRTPNLAMNCKVLKNTMDLPVVLAHVIAHSSQGFPYVSPAGLGARLHCQGAMRMRAGARLHCQGARGASKNTKTPQHDVPLYDLNTYMCIILSCALCLCKSYKQIIRTPGLAMNCKKLKDTTDYVSGHLPNCVPLLAPSQLRRPLRRQMYPCHRFAAPSSGKRKRHPCVERWRERAGDRERERAGERERHKYAT